MGAEYDKLLQLQNASVREFPGPDGQFGNFLISLMVSNSGIAPWGGNVSLRDKQLREFYPTEPWLASTVGSLSQRNGAFSWTLEGPPRTVKRLQDVFHFSDYGRGWVSLMQKLTVDLFTQDNGAFIEVVRDGDGPEAPLLGLGHLDAGRCTRTGNLEFPVVYSDLQGRDHKLSWWQVIPIADAPSPVESMNGAGMCAISRLLLYAQITYAALTYEWEKTAGRNPGALHVVSGVSSDKLQQALKTASENASNKGLQNYQLPAILGTLDPQAKVELVTIALKSLPEGYSREEEHKWYIACMAQAFGVEYQDIAPLPGGGLGTSAQSQTLHMKAKGKGPEWFKKTITHWLNWYVLPQNVDFKFTEQDYEAEQVKGNVQKGRAETYKLYFDMGMPPQVIWQMAQDAGDLTPEYLAMLEAQDATPEMTGTDEERIATPEELAAAGQTVTPVTPTTPVAGEPVAKARVKQLVDDAYWDRARKKLEREYEADLTETLARLGREFATMLRQAEA